MGAVLASSDADTLVPPQSGSNPNKIVPGLADVSETMLWALHNRAAEARRLDGVLTDPDSVRIHKAIDYDFAGHFGDPVGSLAARAAAIDQALRQWLVHHPDGFVVSLGEGLETQAHRVDNGRVRWLSVDLPDAVRLREQFLKPTGRFRHSAMSALDPAWMDAVDASRGVFIIAQGLLMYLQPEMVRRLFSNIAERFPGAEMVFDVVPRWFSGLTMIGLQQTPCYRLPPMPWGISRDELAPTLRRWHVRIDGIVFLEYHIPRGPLGLWTEMLHFVPMVRNELPSLAHIRIATAPRLYASRNTQMTSSNTIESGVDTINDMLALATRTAASGSDLALAAGQIIAKRVALGAVAAVNPLAADHAEFARMVPEKVEAFSAAGMVMFEQSKEAGSQMTRFASDEVMTAARATVEIATCRSPAALLEAQGRFARAWFDRAASHFVAMGMMVLGAQAAVLGPLELAVAANTERLGR